MGSENRRAGRPVSTPGLINGSECSGYSREKEATYQQTVILCSTLPDTIDIHSSLPSLQIDRTLAAPAPSP